MFEWEISLRFLLVITNICIGWIPFHLCSVKHKHDNDGQAKKKSREWMSTKYVYQNAPRLKFESYAPVQQWKHETNISINQSKQISIGEFSSFTLVLFTQLCKRWYVLTRTCIRVWCVKSISIENWLVFKKLLKWLDKSMKRWNEYFVVKRCEILSLSFHSSDQSEENSSSVNAMTSSSNQQ